MADRLDFYFRQRVTEAELDLAFELLEKADRNLAADIGIYGIISGAAPVPHAPVPDLSIDLTAPGRAYDNLGQRIFFGTGQTVDCSVDHAGIPTEVLEAGQERWLGVFLAFDRHPSDPRTDGNSQQVFFRRDESFAIVVRQAAPGPAGAAPKVALQPDELLLCDVRRSNGQSQILDVDIDTTRRQVFIFAQGDAVAITSGLWTTLRPAVDTVQAALDATDSELSTHFAGAARRHPAAHIDYAPRGFLQATSVQGALDEFVDDLSSTDAAGPGASRIGAAPVTGTPHALAAGHMGGQLAQILGWLNQHLGATAGAHNASAITAAAHAYIASPSVQAQLQEIVSSLESQDAGAPGASHVGAAAVAGTPHALAAGTTAAQLAQLLAAINGHQGATTSAHPAAAISVADAGNHLLATDTEAALTELASTLQADHLGAEDANTGQHRTIHQPTLGTGRVLLWESLGVGGVRARLRVHADIDSVWFTVNAVWNGSAWARDSTSHFAGGFRFSRSEFEILHENTFATTFTSWSHSWLLPLSSNVNSGFELTGSVREVGRLGMQNNNTHTGTRNVSMGGAVTFRARFPATPSSITFSQQSASIGWSGIPNAWTPDRDGCGFFANQSAGANTTVYWYGSYDAIA